MSGNPVAVVGNETVASGLKDARNYHRWMMSLVSSHVGHRVLDVGGGTGNHLELLLELADTLAVLDISAASLDLLKRRTSGAGKQLDFIQGDICDEATAQQAVRYAPETITCFDVLEHIKDDARALRQMYQILHPQRGTIILKVPAHPFLYGSMDHLGGHHRRYTRAALSSRLAEAGFRVVECSHVNAIGAVAWLITGRVIRPRRLSAPSVNWQIRVFDRYVVPLQRRIEAWTGTPFGQSLIAVGEAR